MKKSAKPLLIIPALWASCFDIVITILHQSEKYWQGNLSLANEGNPFGNFFMNWHQSGIFIISAFWLLLIVLLGYKLPQHLSRFFLLFVLIAHSFGGGNWLYQHYGFFSAIILFVVNAFLWELFNSGLIAQQQSKS
jgi:hypothetical protein